MRNLLKAVLILVPAILWEARADHVTLANGRAVEGKAEARGDRVRVHLRKGWVEFPKADVARVEQAPTPWEIYVEKAAALTPEDAAGHLALAAWCREQGLPEEMKAEYEAALAADPDCEEAREALEIAEVQPEEEKKAELRKPVEDDARPVEGLFGPLDSERRRPVRPSYSAPLYSYPAGILYGVGGSVYVPVDPYCGGIRRWAISPRRWLLP